MIDLYAIGSPNVVKIYAALEEMALPYRVIPVDTFAGKQFDSAFTKLSPTAKAAPETLDRMFGRGAYMRA